MQVNWPTLWMSWRERELREIIVLPIIVLIMLVPVGAFSGAASGTRKLVCVPCGTIYLLTARPTHTPTTTPKQALNLNCWVLLYLSAQPAGSHLICDP